MMASVRSRDTQPELMLRSALREAGLVGYRLHRKDIAGSPDIAWIGARVAVFVDGSFWHGHPSAFTPGKSGAFWDEKIRSNIERDQRVNTTLSEDGWRVLRFWDFEVKDNPGSCVEVIRDVLERARPDS